MNKAQEILKWFQYLEQSQWWTKQQLEEAQETYLKRIVLHHAAQSPWFKQRLKDLKIPAMNLFTLAGLKSLPPMTKRDIQNAKDSFFARTVPPQHKPVGDISTSGSTGEPISVKKTFLDDIIWNAITLREHSWYQRDFNGKLAAIKAGIKKDVVSEGGWGQPVSYLFKSGAALGIPVFYSVEEQLKMLNDFQPDIMIVHAGVLMGFVNVWERDGNYSLQNLKHCRNVSDTVSEDLRIRFKAISGLNIEDNYSCSETGSIAMQCPASGLYHTMMETVIVEVLDKDGNDCQPGEVGRVVLTDLHNTGNPIIRYDIGDYAEVGEPCSCGRNHTTLKKILGRERNLLVTPDGIHFWPRAGRYALQKVVPVRQWQIVQTTVTDIEFRIVTDDPLTDEQKDKVAETFREALVYPFNISVVWYKDRIPPGPSGKFEESICLVK
jgi:phenylacetate-CoA ligase